MSEIGGGNDNCIEITLDEVRFLFEQHHTGRHGHGPFDAARIASAQSRRLCLLAAFLMKQLQVAVAHCARADKAHANLSRHAGTLPERVPCRQARVRH